LVDLKPNGQLRFEKTVGGYYDDWGGSVVELGKNKFKIGGYSASPAGADKTENSHGYGDYWLVELNYDKASESTDRTASNMSSQAVPNNLNNKAFTIYPNPPFGILNISVDTKAVVSLTDQSGKLILTKTIDGNNSIDVSKLSSGVYFLKNNTTGETKKVMISK
jgi:hypothetical protein